MFVSLSSEGELLFVHRNCRTWLLWQCLFYVLPTLWLLPVACVRRVGACGGGRLKRAFSRSSKCYRASTASFANHRRLSPGAKCPFPPLRQSPNTGQPVNQSAVRSFPATTAKRPLLLNSRPCYYLNGTPSYLLLLLR